MFDHTADALLSPANSFGFMRGGVDAAYTARFGPGLEKRVRARVAAAFDGELPVGEAIIVPLPPGSDPYSYMVSAPTMRVPEPIDRTANVFLAFRAALRAVRRHNAHVLSRGASGDELAGPEVAIRTLLTPALGTGFGGVDPAVCARQMAAAYEVAVLGEHRGTLFAFESMEAAEAGHRYLLAGEGALPAASTQ